MNRIFAALLGTALAAVPTISSAQSPASSSGVALFFRTVSPAFIWGQNGVLTTPSAMTVGKYRLTVESSFVPAGKVQGEVLLDGKVSLTLALGGEVEFGYTRKDLVWVESFERTPLGADVFYFKYKVLDIEGADQWWVPKVAVGARGFQVTAQDHFDLSDVFLELFAVATEVIPISGTSLRFNGGASVSLLASRSTIPYLFGGIDYTFLDEWITVATEFMTPSQSAFDPVINAGVATNIFGVGQVGFMVYNLTRPGEIQYMLNLALTLPVGAYWNQLWGYKYEHLL